MGMSLGIPWGDPRISKGVAFVFLNEGIWDLPR